MSPSSPSIRFITEGDDQIGYGHLMRTLVLSRAFADAGYRTAIQPRENQAMQFLEKQGGRVAANLIDDHQPSDWVAWDVRDPVPAGEFETALSHSRHSLMIDERGEMRTRANVVADALMVPSRAGELPHGEKTDYLYGLEFFPLDPACLALRNSRAAASAQLRHPLIAFGGSDPAGLTLPFVRALAAAKFRGPCHVVTGIDHPDLEALKESIPSIGGTLSEFVDDLPRRISEASALVTKLGLTAIEAFSIGTPVILIEPYPFHEEVSDSLALHYPDWPAFNYGLGTESSFADAARFLANGQFGPAEASWKLVDGLGACRIVEHLSAFSSS